MPKDIGTFSKILATSSEIRDTIDMDSMQNILKNKSPSEPPQVTALKKYAKENHNVEIAVRVSKSHYLITVPGAGIAQKLRIETAQIVSYCNLEKRLVIHIGH